MRWLSRLKRRLMLPLFLPLFRKRSHVHSSPTRTVPKPKASEYKQHTATLLQAADRIEALEAALRAIIAIGDAVPESIAIGEKAADIARRALEGTSPARTMRG